MSEQPRCDKCRFWTPAVEDINAVGSNEPTCKSPRLKLGYGWDWPAGTLVQVEDDMGWGIRTAPDFGCVMFEPTETA